MKFLEQTPKRMIDTKSMPKEEWLEHRRKGITGTDVAAIFGMNPYKTEYQTYQDKLGNLPEVEDNNHLRFGRDSEDLIAKWFCEDTGKKVQNQYAIFQHKNYPWMLANIDRKLIGESAILECKSAVYRYQKDLWGDSGTDIVPEYYLFQVYHYMIVMGVRRGYLAVLFTDTKDFRIYNFDLDEELAEEIIKVTHHFWNEHVLAGVEPPIATMEDLVLKHPKDNGESLQTDDSSLTLCLEHERIRQQVGELQKKQEAIKLALGIILGENKQVLSDNDKTLAAFTKTAGRTMVDKTKLKQLDPKIYKQCTYTTAPTRNVTLRWQTLKSMVANNGN